MVSSLFVLSSIDSANSKLPHKEIEMADLTFTRSITFTIPGSNSSPGVKVTAVENATGGVDFTVDVLSTSKMTADLRGLFFNLNDTGKLAGLSSTGLSVTDFDTVNVINLGGGANMHGHASPYDVGLEFGTSGIGKDHITSATFTLSGSTFLTLDDIANVEFGARLTSIGSSGGARNGSSKIVAEAPAAPDAIADSYAIFEDGQEGLDDPADPAEGVVFQVLDNDTDADGDTLTVVALRDAVNGAVEIVDGNDSDTLIGDAVKFTPTTDYAGPASFEYAISDGAGGTDFAKVDVAVTAVADIPSLSYQIIAGNSADEIIVRVAAAQTDADSSEYIDRIELSGIPDGVTAIPGVLNPGAEPDQIVQDFILTLPLDQDVSFDFGIAAVSKEVSNGDEETNFIAVPIVLEYTENDYAPTFYATDQSIWSSGDQFTFNDNRFIGVDNFASPFTDSSGGLIGYNVSAAIKAGLQSNLSFEGGEIDANLNYDFSVDTNYNKTTDMLLISSSQVLTGGDFATEGPEGSYKLDFIFNYDVSAALTYDIGVDSGTIVSFADSYYSTTNILDLDSDDLAVEIPFPDPFGSLSATLAWPDIETDASATPPPIGEYTASGASNNFLELNLDVDQALADILLKGVNPFSIEADIVVAGATLDLIDLDLYGGLNFLQSFVMQEQGVNGTLHFENGYEQAFVFGSDIQLSNASQIDAGGDNDGNVEFSLSIDPQATLHNDTDLGFNVGYNFDVFKVGWWYDIGVDSDSGTIGPLYNAGGNFPIATVGVYDSTFDLNFGSQDVGFYA
jgi:hypothetical protein